MSKLKKYALVLVIDLWLWYLIFLLYRFLNA